MGRGKHGIVFVLAGPMVGTVRHLLCPVKPLRFGSVGGKSGPFGLLCLAYKRFRIGSMPIEAEKARFPVLPAQI